jgi:hypothetical protein
MREPVCARAARSPLGENADFWKRLIVFAQAHDFIVRISANMEQRRRVDRRIAVLAADAEER